MRFCQLVYASTIGHTLSVSDVQSLAKSAAASNQQCGVTGMLLLSPKHFVQVLEGPADTVNPLYLRIGQDARHERVVLLDYQYIARTQYPDWGMTLVPIADTDWRAIGSAHSAQGEFAPYLMDGIAVQTLFARARTRATLAALAPRTPDPAQEPLRAARAHREEAA